MYLKNSVFMVAGVSKSGIAATMQSTTPTAIPLVNVPS